jgi:hypothetical protein
MTGAQAGTGFVPAVLKTASGLFLAPIVGGAIAMPLYPLLLNLIRGMFVSLENLRDLGSMAQTGALLGAWMGVIPAFVLGVPVHALLMKTRKTHLLFYVGLGSVIAFVSFVTLSPLYGFGVAWGPSIRAYLPVVPLCGGLGGVLFWFIRRPDRDSKAVMST